MRSFQERVFIVTGGASGMGRELVLELLKSGADVCAIDINEQGLEETRKLADVDKKRLSTFVVDITNIKQVEELPQKVVSYHGKVDGIFNNAGIIQPMKKFEELSPAFVEKIFNINAFSVFNLTRAFLPEIMKSDEGYVVNTSSMGGFLPVPGQAIYGATKSAVKLFTEALYAELYNTNVNVSIVFPGAIKTDIAKNSGIEMKEGDLENSKIKMTSANDAAKIMLKGVKKEKLRILVGKDAWIMDKYYRLFPVKAIKLMQKMLASIIE
ncbi:MAG: SDR family oxidoreductase [Firmicutes bacterium]|nr:SDR family oxidoreductase [Bacillota bacterium]